MSENQLQHLFQAFGDISPCVQTPLSQTVCTSMLAQMQSRACVMCFIFSSSSPTTKEELGRATWTFLHTLATQYPDMPTRQQKKDVKELAGPHDEFFSMFVTCTILGKLVFPCERVDARWGKLECEQHACDLQGTSMNFGNKPQ
ncbi:hypothetical protein Pfo_004830 [Paulownia fortunei]|nr:hypothetical protein Pfo_004830 [Paulownia fortunei]